MVTQTMSAKAHIVRRYLRRDIAPTVTRMLQHMPVVVVTGMRQVGKTTMLVNDPLFKDRDYVTLEDTAVQLGISQNPDEFLSSYERVTIDEAQKDPDLVPALRRVVHADQTRGRFILSGSSTLQLKRAAAESLAGDAVYLRMGPLSRRELLGDISRPPFLTGFIDSPGRPAVMDFSPVTPTEVLRGGMPGVVLPSWEAAQVWLSGYEQTYLERDILYLSRIESLSGFRALLALLATRSAGILNVDNLTAQLGGLGRNTVKRYIDLMKELFIVDLLDPYSRNVSVRTRKQPKVLLADSGIACYMAGITDVTTHPLGGLMYETYVHQNLAAILQAHAHDWKLYYWRVRGREVDFVVDTRDQAVGIEVKSSEALDLHDADSLRTFMDNVSDCKLCILAYNGDSLVDLGGGVWAVPLGLLLS